MIRYLLPFYKMEENILCCIRDNLFSGWTIHSRVPTRAAKILLIFGTFFDISRD
jgi:hypothetical protein